MKLLKTLPTILFFTLSFALPVFAADFESEVENGLVKKNAIKTENLRIEFSDIIANQTDSDGDGIADIIETVAEAGETSYTLETGELGYEEPFDESNGRKLIVILDDTYAYLEEGVLGITGLLSNGDPYVALDPWMSDDYLKITIAHEVFHAIQFGYDVNFAYTYQGINWAEASAVWMEDIVFDEINDYALYIPDFFTYVDYSIFASIVPTDSLYEYGMNIWPRFLAEYYGTNNVIREIWESYFASDVGYDSDLKIYDAVNEVIGDRGGTLEQIFQQFTLWNLDLSQYEEGELYPQVFVLEGLKAEDYTLIEGDYAPALYGSNYLYFENSTGENNFYFHIVKPEGVSYAVSLVPYQGDDFNSDAAVTVLIEKNEEMDQALFIQGIDQKDGIMAIVSSLEKEFDSGNNSEVFDEGYLYYYLAEFGTNEADFSEKIGVSEDEEMVEEIEEVEETKEGEDVEEAPDVRNEDTLGLTLLSYDEDSATFSWNRLLDSAVDGYEIRYGLESQDYSDVKNIENDYTTSAKVSDLEEGNTYYFQLIALDDENDQVGEESQEVVVTTAEWIFEDISYLDEHYDAISALTEIGIFKGYTDGTFRPNNEINRAELLKILIEGRDIEIDESRYENCFPDVHEEWFASYVCYAEAKGWVKGYSDGYFRPENSVNKVEALKMLFKVYEAGLTEGIRVASLSYSDLDEGAWYAIYVWKASDLGILEEEYGGEFNPELARTRGEMAEELYRYLVVTEVLKE